MAFTREQLIAAARAAEKAGDIERRDRLVKQAQDLQAPASDIMSDLPGTLRAIDDLTNVSMDAFSRGFGGRKDAVRGSRERLPGWAEVPADIAGGIAGAPYKVAGKLASVGVGGVEGALDAYGHQDDWVPDAEGWKDIGTGALTGSGLGLAGAKAGEMLGGLWDRARRKGSQMFKSDEELTSAADEAFKQDPGSGRTSDLTDRSLRTAAIRDAQGSDRDTFGRMLEGMDAPAGEKKVISDIAANKPGIANRAVQGAGKVADAVQNYLPRNVTIPGMAAEAFLGGGVPWLSGAGALATKGASWAGRKAGARNYPSAKEIDDLLMKVRDPTGRSEVLSSEMTDAMRDALAKFGIGAGKNL